MILINKNTSNSVVLTLNEGRTTENPVYVFLFIDDQTQENKIFYSQNLSTNKDRYDLFNIIENDTEDLSNGIISLNEGFQHYLIYENNLSGKILERGKVKVLGTTTEYVFEPDYNTTTKVYNPQ